LYKIHIYADTPANDYPLKMDCSHGQPERRERGTIDEVAAKKRNQ